MEGVVAVTLTFTVDGQTMDELAGSAWQIVAKFAGTSIKTAAAAWQLEIDARPLLQMMDTKEPKSWTATVTATLRSEPKP